MDPKMFLNALEFENCIVSFMVLCKLLATKTGHKLV